LLEVKRQGYHNELIPVYLLTGGQIEPILLAPKPDNEIRLRMGGF